MEDNILRPGSSLIYAIGEKGGEDDWLIGASPLNDEVINLAKKADESKLKYFDIDDNKLVTIHLGDNDEIKFDLKKFSKEGSYDFEVGGHKLRLQKNALESKLLLMKGSASGSLIM